jgi:hypothetical protein
MYVTAVSERSVAHAEGGGRFAADRITRDARSAAPRLVRALVGVGLAAAVLMAPLLAWIHLHRTLTSSRLSSSAAAAVGAREAGLDPTVFARLTRIIPPHATYWIDTSGLIRSSVTRQAFPAWASGSLLPRIAVRKPAEADWVVIWGYSPKRLRIEIDGIRVLRTRSAAQAPVYVARVAHDR